MRRLSLRREQLTVPFVWECYQEQRDVLSEYQGIVEEQHGSHAAGTIPKRYIGLTRDEVRRRFARLLEEVDYQACLALLSAAEALLRVDFELRVRNKRKDPVSRKFRAIYRAKAVKDRRRIELESEILDTWKENLSPACAKIIGEFRGALRYRHWLAHGRYWTPKFGRAYLPVHVREIILNLMREIEVEVPGFQDMALQ